MIGRVYVLMDRHHALPVRIFLSWFGFALGLLLTMSPIVASIASKHFRADRAKTALRFLSWCAEYGWIGKSIRFDPVFDISIGLGQPEIHSLAKFVTSRRGRPEAWRWATDELLLRSRIAEHQSIHGNAYRYRQELDRFRETALEAVKIVAETSRPSRPFSQQVGTEHRSLDAADADKALKAFAEVAVDLEFTWFAVSGTFLGIVREKDWLAHDYDIDLGVMHQDVDLKEIACVLASNEKFRIRQLSYQRAYDDQKFVEIPTCLKLTHRATKVDIDIFAHVDDGEISWHGSMINRWDNKSFGLSTYQFRSFEILGPSDFDTYLTENYGDWRIPVKAFSSTDGSGTPNFVMIKNLFSVALFLKRIVYAQTSHRQMLWKTMESSGAVRFVEGRPEYRADFCRPTLIQDQ